MSNLEIFRIDNIKWWITTNASGGRVPVPLCPKHNLRLTAIMPTYWDGRRSITGSAENSIKLNCAEGPHEIPISRKYFEERQYVIDRIDAKVFKDVKILNLDDEAVPIAKDKKYSKDGKLFVTSQLMESKRGIQVVIYAGKKGSAKKTQILISIRV